MKQIVISIRYQSGEYHGQHDYPQHPDDVLERFKARAKTEGKSAEQLARDAIASAAKPSREEVFRR